MAPAPCSLQVLCSDKGQQGACGGHGGVPSLCLAAPAQRPKLAVAVTSPRSRQHGSPSSFCSAVGVWVTGHFSRWLLSIRQLA